MKTSTILSFLGAGVALMLLSKKSEASGFVPGVPNPQAPKTPKVTPKTPEPSTTLSDYERSQLENFSDDELYRMAMTATYKAFVIAVADRLAGKGDTRAGDLTLRLANWST